jgi:hypothetical protein
MLIIAAVFVGLLDADNGLLLSRSLRDIPSRTHGSVITTYNRANHRGPCVTANFETRLNEREGGGGDLHCHWFT